MPLTSSLASSRRSSASIASRARIESRCAFRRCSVTSASRACSAAAVACIALARSVRNVAALALLPAVDVGGDGVGAGVCSVGAEGISHCRLASGCCGWASGSRSDMPRAPGNRTHDAIPVPPLRAVGVGDGTSVDRSGQWAGRPARCRWSTVPPEPHRTAPDRTCGAPGRIRTCDLPLRRRLLCPLSYGDAGRSLPSRSGRRIADSARATLRDPSPRPGTGTGSGGPAPPMSARPAHFSAGQLALELPVELPAIELLPEWKDQQRLWGHAVPPDVLVPRELSGGPHPRLHRALLAAG